MQRRKWLIYLPPILFLIVSIGVMAGGGLLKKPLGKDDRLVEAVQNLEKHVQNKEWKQANTEINYAQKAWGKIVNRIQFSVERDHMFQISGALARMKGGVEAKDDKAVLLEIYFFYDLWENLGS